MIGGACANDVSLYSTLLYTEVAPVAFAAIDWKYYLVFILVPAACVPLMWLFLPETNGKYTESEDSRLRIAFSGLGGRMTRVRADIVRCRTQR